MTFVWPQMLWLLVLVPSLAGLYVWILRRRKRAVMRYGNLAIVKAAMGKSMGWRRHVPPALLLAAVTVLIVAVARPEAVVTLASSPCGRKPPPSAWINCTDTSTCCACKDAIACSALSNC